MDAAVIVPPPILDGRYRLEQLVGKGGFGVVYRAVHLQLGKPVAVKVLQASLFASETARAETLARFVQEGQVLAKLRHPHIVAALDVGTFVDEHGTLAPYLVMEWCAGKALREWLRGGRGLPLSQAVAVFEPILDAMAHAHAARVVHRDLKSANVMVEARDEGWFPRVVDFGVAREMEADAAPGGGATMSASGRSPHTPGYAAPEQLVGARTGPWTDVHALGLLFVELVTGASPLRGLDAVQAASMPRPTPRAFGRNIGTLEPVVARALALRPQDRFADAGLFLEAWKTAKSSWSEGEDTLVATGEGRSTAHDTVLVDPTRTSEERTPQGVATRVGSKPGATEPASERSRKPAARAGSKFRRWMAAGAVVLASSAAVAVWATRSGSRGARATSALDGLALPDTPQDACSTPGDVLLARVAPVAGAGILAAVTEAAAPEGSSRSLVVTFSEGPFKHVSVIRYDTEVSPANNSLFARFYGAGRAEVAGAYGGSGLCHIRVEGIPGADVLGLLRAAAGDQELQGVATWPPPPPRRLSELGPWELADFATGRGDSRLLAVTERSAAVMTYRLRGVPGLTVHIASDTLFAFDETIPVRSSAFAHDPPTVVWTDGGNATAVATLQNLLGSLARVVPGEGLDARLPGVGGTRSFDLGPLPSDAAWAGAAEVVTSQFGRMSCGLKTRAGWWRVGCRTLGGGVVLASVLSGSIGEMSDAGGPFIVFHTRQNALRAQFQGADREVVYDSITHTFHSD